MSYLSTDLSMASISEVKVENLDEVIKEAQTAIDGHLIDSEQYQVIQTALDRINETQDYEITPEFVQEIDETINTVDRVIVDRNGAPSVAITGTESFGLTLSPKEWRKTRVAGCESILEELAKNIKRWTNQLGEKLSEIFTGNRYTIDSLSERLVELDKKLTFIETISDQNELVTIPSAINKSFRYGNGYLTTNTNFSKILDNEINFIGIVVKSWAEESVRHKNNIIRYFGNKGRDNYEILHRQHPKLFNKKDFVDEDNSDFVYWTIPQRFLGMGSIWFIQYQGKDYNDLSSLVGFEESTGYDFISKSGTGKPNPDLNIKPFSINDLENIKNSIKRIIEIMRLLNQKNNDFDADTKDIKDVLNTLRNLGDETLIDNFSGLVAHYQENTIYVQSSFIRYLGQLASHLITFMFIHMEAYDDA